MSSSVLSVDVQIERGCVFPPDVCLRVDSQVWAESRRTHQLLQHRGPMSALLRSRFKRATLLLSLAGWLSACHTWVPLAPLDQGLREQSAMQIDERERLRLYLRDGRVVEGQVVELGADTVSVGSDSDHYLLVPLANVMGARVLRPDSRKTVVTIVGIAATTAGVVIAVVANKDTEEVY